MFLGHFALGLAAKRAGPGVSLGTLFVAVQLVDLLWPVFLVLGLEHARPDPGNTATVPIDFYDYLRRGSGTGPRRPARDVGVAIDVSC